jgi:putative DNA primase/helicase
MKNNRILENKDEVLLNPESYKKHFDQLIIPLNNILSHNEILDVLLEQIKPINFKILAFPEIEKKQNEFIKLQKQLYEVDVKDRENISHLINNLQKELSSYKLNNKHYIVISIENILSVALKNKWNLCKNMDYIYLYNGNYWSSIEKETIQKFLGDASLKQGVEKISSKYYQFREKLFSQFICEAYLPNPIPNNNLVLINLLNGTFEINGKNTRLRPFSSNDFLTYQLPFNYDPSAKAPIFQNYLNTVIPEIEKQNVLAEYLGSIFIKHGSKLLKEEKALILYGTGANGKSVFFEIVNALLGSQNISYHSLQDLTNENGYYRAMIGNVLLNYASEINGKLEASIFKKMVSGEPISARLPYGQPMQLTQYAKLIFNCNELPKDVEHTNAFFRRFLIITFDVTIKEENQDKQLHTKIIENELSQVFLIGF